MVDACTCLKYLARECEAEDDHVCVCRAIIDDKSVFAYLVSNCRSPDIHVCICPDSVFLTDSNSEKGTSWCRSPIGHVCTCDSASPSQCRAYRHTQCICISSDDCQLAHDLVHQCICDSRSDGDCRSTNRKHRCICPALSCRVRYGYHKCICRKDVVVECKSRIHAEDSPGSHVSI